MSAPSHDYVTTLALLAAKLKRLERKRAKVCDQMMNLVRKVAEQGRPLTFEDVDRVCAAGRGSEIAYLLLPTSEVRAYHRHQRDAGGAA